MADDDEVRLTLRLPRELSERVEAAARADRRSKNAELVTLIESALASRASGKEAGETQ
jgi:Arc-like DNA binding domain